MVVGKAPSQNEKLNEETKAIEQQQMRQRKGNTNEKAIPILNTINEKAITILFNEEKTHKLAKLFANAIDHFGFAVNAAATRSSRRRSSEAAKLQKIEKIPGHCHSEELRQVEQIEEKHANLRVEEKHAENSKKGEKATKCFPSVAGDGGPNTSITRWLTDDVAHTKKNCLVKLKGQWYDMGKYMDRHPGGDIIKEFVGKDATIPFRMWHPTKVYDNPHRYLGSAIPEEKIRFLNDGSEKNNDGSDFCESQYTLAGSRPRELEKPDHAYLELYRKFEERGYFRATGRYLSERILIVLGLMIATMVCMNCFNHYGCYSVFFHVLGAFFLYLVFSQSAGILHDAGHNQYFSGQKDQIKKNERLAFLFGNLGMGISSAFWKWEHVEHHTFTNSYDDEHGTNADVQQAEDVWIQDRELALALKKENALRKEQEQEQDGKEAGKGKKKVNVAPHFTAVQRLVLRTQEFLFPIAIIFFARIGIVIDSFILERRFYEFVGLAIHLTWLYVGCFYRIHTDFGGVYAFKIFYVACMWNALLAFQLMSNHMDKPFLRKHEESEVPREKTHEESQEHHAEKGHAKENHAESAIVASGKVASGKVASAQVEGEVAQVEGEVEEPRCNSFIARHIVVCTNIWCPRWLDWWWGGLQFHQEHHCFPRMARQYYREASKDMKTFCGENGIAYNLSYFLQTLWKIDQKLKHVRSFRDVILD